MRAIARILPNTANRVQLISFQSNTHLRAIMEIEKRRRELLDKYNRMARLGLLLSLQSERDILKEEYLNMEMSQDELVAQYLANMQALEFLWSTCTK